MKSSLVKIFSLITATAVFLSVISAGTVSANSLSDTIDYDPLLTTEYTFSDIKDVKDTFACYSYKTSETFGEFDKETYTPTYTSAEVDPSTSWQTDTATGGLIRKGSGDYVGGSGRNGGSLLYFNDTYSEFEIEFEYCFSETDNSWRWVGVGFGAEQMGDDFPFDSYFAVVEKEGTVRLHNKVGQGNAPLSRINTGANDEYKSAVDSDRADNTETWHNMRVSVLNGICYISYDGNAPYTGSVTADEGYIYLYSNTEGMKFRNIKVSTPLKCLDISDEERAAGWPDEEIWPEEYEVESYVSTSVTDIDCGNKKFSFETSVNEESMSLAVTFPKEGGIRLTGESTGFFEPEGVNSISYKTVSSGVELTSGEEKALFTYSASGWRLITYKDGEQSVAVDSEALFFGYKQSGEIGRIKYSFPIASGELFYGLGERFNSVIQNGYTVTLWNHDNTYHVEGASGDKTDSYANVPILHSTAGYTLFFNSTYSAEADIGYTDSDSFSFDFNGDILDLYIWNGTPAENISDYTAVTGSPYSAPEWAYGYWAGAAKAVYTDENGESVSSAEEVTSVLSNILAEYEAMGVKPAALYSEGTYIDNWSSTFPLLTENGINALSWTGCSKSYSTLIGNLDTSVTKLPLVRMLSDPFSIYGISSKVYIDYTNPLSKQLIKNLFSDMADSGLRGLMVDMGEYIGENTTFYNGKNGDEMHNLYSYYYGKTVNEAFTELLEDDFVLFQRSGSAGSQGYSVLFGGDQAARWYGLRQQVNCLLTSSASGYSLYGGDIGGFYGKPTDELYSRWVQFSVFGPIMREHGSHAEDTLPWTYSEDAQANFKKYYQIREALKSYIYSSALISSDTGVPITQSLAFAYPQDSSLHSIDDEYIFCDKLLVAPVLDEGATEREVTLPSGTWYDFYSGTALSGGQTVTASAPTDTIPVYIASGAAVPLMLLDNLNVTESGEREVLLVTQPEENASVTVKEDENTSFEYGLTPLNDMAFELKKPEGDGIKTLLIYGFKATNVCVNGTELKTSDGSSAGFAVKDGNTVIYLSSDSAATVEIYGAGILRESNITEISPADETELSQYTCYSAPKDGRVEYTDSEGNSVYKQAAVSDIWSVPYTGVIERQSISDYTSTGSRTGASSLYFDGSYTDFELNMSYCYNGAKNTNWRWVAVGFGAENTGDSYYDSGYLGYVEVEGTVKVLGDYNTAKSEITTYRLFNTTVDEYKSSVSNVNLWHTFTLRVMGDTVTVGYDGNEYSMTLSDYNGGQIYLHCFTNGMRFKDISITDLSGVSDYGEYDRFEIECSKALGGSITSDVPYAVSGQTVELTVSCLDGYNASGKLKLMGYNGTSYTVTEISADKNGNYSFIMPDYPIYIKGEFYILGDATADNKVNVIDLIRLKKYLAGSSNLISQYASDINADNAIDVNDIAGLKRTLLKR